jgi:hypothetical protein
MNCPEINGFITGGIYMFYEKKLSTPIRLLKCTNSVALQGIPGI